jgi:cytochrome c peroxidase
VICASKNRPRGKRSRGFVFRKINVEERRNIMNNKICGTVIVAIFLLVATEGFAGVGQLKPSLEKLLGQFLYFDKNLSNPVGQACASCHLPRAGYADPDQNLPVSEGAVTGRFGGRNAPSSAYAAFSPVFGKDPSTGQYIGGQFWDGRAPTLEEQAKGPFLNPVEMNNTKEGVVQSVRSSRYALLFEAVYGIGSLENVDTAYDLVAKAIASFERMHQVNRFSSKYDYYLKGKVTLTDQENRGLQLFSGKGNCSACHPSTSADGKTPPLFTDYTYDNLGVPKNMEYPYYLMDTSPYPDPGLGKTVGDPAQNGKFKVMTLRNIALTAPYSHNGYFKTLKDIVHFYNTRDIPGMWPEPDVPETVNKTELGNLGLTDQEEDDIVAFLLTLSDGFACR